MNRTSKLLLVAMAVATATISALSAGSAFQGEEMTTASSDPTRFSLTVENGTPGGNYEAGTLVIVSADAPQAGGAVCGLDGRRGDPREPIYTHDDRDDSVHGGNDHCDLHCATGDFYSTN